MALGPDIASADYEIFENPPLKAMLGQVRFPPVLKIADMQALGQFQEAIRDEWPEFVEEQQVSIVLGPGGPPQSGAVNRVFRFRTGDRAWSVVLAPDSLTLEADEGVRYTSYEEFGKRFRQVWTVAADHFRPAHVLRQGLRYVDHIERELSAADWAALINPELLGPLTGPLGVGVVQAASELRYQREDGVLAFKHGIVRAGPENTEGYLLDFDYFTEEREDDVSVEVLMSRFDRYHEAIYGLFRWCVTDEAIKEFRGGN